MPNSRSSSNELIDRWMAEEHDGANPDAVRRAAEACHSRLPTMDPTSFWMDGLESLSLLGSLSCSSASTIASASSYCSRHSCTSAYSRGRRQGRRLHPYSRSLSHNTSHLSVESDETEFYPESQPLYWCTYCGKSRKFRDREAWVRHERDIHHPTKTWVCPGWQDGRCFYCGFEGSKESHKCCECATLSEERRIFPRKDNFLRHVRTQHLGPLRGLWSETKEQFEKASCRTTTFEPWDERCRCPFDDCLELHLDMLMRNAHVVDVHFTRQQENGDIGTRERPSPHGVELSTESRPRSSCPSLKESLHIYHGEPDPFRIVEGQLKKVDILLKSLSSAVTMEFRNHLEQDLFEFREQYLNPDDPVPKLTLYGAEAALYDA